MTEDGTSKKIIKATLEAVFQSQERLRKHLDLLAEQNRPLDGSSERDLFFRELTYSTLGLGCGIILRFQVPNGGYVGLNHDLETVARWLAYQNSSKVWVPIDLYKKNYRREDEKDVDIQILWNFLREQLFTVFPLAVDRATSLSKEQPEQMKSKGFQVDYD